jgi:ribosome recycling factor
MVKEQIQAGREHFEQAVEHFIEEAAKLRSGRANPALLEGILVDYYGTRTPLKQIANVTIPEARQILVQPWDKGAMQPIETAIRESDLGLNPGNDGNVIRITLPQLTEERRRELVKALNARAEESRISIRSTREEIWKEIQDLEKAGTIGEDDKFSGKDELQKVVDEYNAKIEALREKKEKEILTV